MVLAIARNGNVSTDSHRLLQRQSSDTIAVISSDVIEATASETKPTSLFDMGFFNIVISERDLHLGGGLLF
jgi:hypothetical protein